MACARFKSYHISSHHITLHHITSYRISGVFGYYKNTEFSILVAHRNSALQLMAGTPVSSSLMEAKDCATRDRETQECTSDSDTRPILAAYFSFTATLKADVSVEVSVMPYNITDDDCDHDSFLRPGCDANHLTVYITSCAGNACSSTNRSTLLFCYLLNFSSPCSCILPCPVKLPSYILLSSHPLIQDSSFSLLFSSLLFSSLLSFPLLFSPLLLK